MTTRGAVARGQVTKEQFEGRVRKWTKRWVPIVKGTQTDEVRLELLKWVQTGEWRRGAHRRRLRARTRTRPRPSVRLQTGPA